MGRQSFSLTPLGQSPGAARARAPRHGEGRVSDSLRRHRAERHARRQTACQASDRRAAHALPRRLQQEEAGRGATHSSGTEALPEGRLGGTALLATSAAWHGGLRAWTPPRLGAPQAMRQSSAGASLMSLVARAILAHAAPLSHPGALSRGGRRQDRQARRDRLEAAYRKQLPGRALRCLSATANGRADCSLGAAAARRRQNCARCRARSRARCRAEAQACARRRSHSVGGACGLEHDARVQVRAGVPHHQPKGGVHYQVTQGAAALVQVPAPVLLRARGGPPRARPARHQGTPPHALRYARRLRPRHPLPAMHGRLHCAVRQLRPRPPPLLPPPGG